MIGMNAESTFAQRLCVALKRAEMSQAELARQVGVTPSSVSQWAKGESKAPTPANLFAAADVLRCSAKWLATGSE